MAAPHTISFFITILVLSFISPSLSANSQKVRLSLYYESLCPYCASFIQHQLAYVFNTDLRNIVDLRLVPFGNAQIFGPQKTIVCQHGPNECYLNTIHACAIKAWPDVQKHLKLIQCIEAQPSSGKQPEAAWRKCCRDLGFSQKPIDRCYQSGEGTTLVLKYAKETASLKPRHRFVPWVTVNDRALQDDFRNVISYVCKAYKGKFTPKVCKSSQHSSTVRASSTLPVCHTGEVRESSLFAAPNKVPTSTETPTKMAPPA